MSLAFERARSVSVAVALAIVLFAAPTSAQQPSVRPYESEEDLWEALHEGEITQAEYDELLELLRLGTDNEFVPASDLEHLPGSGAGYLSPGDSAQSHFGIAKFWSDIDDHVSMNLRNGFDGRLSSSPDNDGYTTGRIQGTSWKALFNWRQDDRGGQWQRRVIELQSHGMTVQAGNVEPRWGRGLVVGRRSRLLGSSASTRPGGDFVQPALSRFNGVWIRSRENQSVAIDLLGSDIRSDNLKERMAGAQVRFARSSLSVGVAALTGTIARTDSSGLFARRVVGTHVHLGSNNREILAEIATADYGASAKAVEAQWAFSRGQFHGRAWSYATDFVNPWGGGPSNSDGTPIELSEIDESYTSRTSGERGFDLSTRLSPASLAGGKATARWDWMTHRETPNEPLQHTWTVEIRWRKSNIMIRPFARGELEEDTRERLAFGFYSDIGPTEQRVSLRFEAGQHNADEDRYVRTGAGGRYRLNQRVLIKPEFRWVDPDLELSADGYWYFYMTEIVEPSESWHVEAALVYQRYENRGREDVVELRLRMVAGW